MRGQFGPLDTDRGTMHTNSTLAPFRPVNVSKRESNAPPADFDFTSATHAAAVFGAFSFEAMTNGARGVELKTYSPNRCAPVALTTFRPNAKGAPVLTPGEGGLCEIVDGEAF